VPVGAGAYAITALGLALLTSLAPALLVATGGGAALGALALAVPLVLAVPLGGVLLPFVVAAGILAGTSFVG
jgi:hypothetical protein